MPAELTTLADDLAVVHDGSVVRRYTDLQPDTDHHYDGVEFRTLPRPGGELLTRFTTANDIHFGETECGVLEGWDDGPVHRSGPGEDPYPEIMNRSVIDDMATLDPAAVIVKGDLTAAGTIYEFRAFLSFYEPAFGDRLHYVRGNHDAYRGETFAADAPFAVELAGVICAVVDTVIPRHTTGRLSADQLAWLDELAAGSDRPVLVFGHHQVWLGGNRHDGYFGVNPDDSDALVQVIARRRRIAGYFAGHTHRNRVRRVSATGDVPYVEVACVKDFPGSWAEYRVYEGGILQVHHRASAPEALAWADRTRDIYPIDYVGYALSSIEDRCFVVA